MNSRRTFALVVSSAFFATLSPSALAYIDSGTGSFFLQAALSGLLGGMLLARTFWSNLISGFRRKPVRSNETPGAQ